MYLFNEEEKKNVQHENRHTSQLVSGVIVLSLVLILFICIEYIQYVFEDISMIA